MINLYEPLFEAVQQAELTDYYFEGDWHWTARGHRLAADSIYLQMVDWGFISNKQGVR